MLTLLDIKKEYKTAGETVQALKGVSLCFRKNEFVSILGASGCGKTTLLNIIGGLDKYTTGDLLINGKSTRQYKDRDWDTYRTHSIGFIFQSYHLIPHQTILQNVELALMIAGVSKEERRSRAIEALEKVGLGDKIKCKPNQLSGGQAQRVAIARALINDPEIVLADEPTGALDSKTSVQIMDLLKEISKDRLVIMVTHNPELAEQYSTRIIRLLDGLVVGDSMPFDGVDREEEQKPEVTEVTEATEITETIKATEASEAATQTAPAKKSKGSKKRSSMSFGMAFMLSLKNLLSKGGRTALVSVAGSIGIIGVSMVLAISAGVQGYIKNMENDMLSGNPVTVSETTLDFAAVMSNMTAQDKAQSVEIKDGYINVNNTVEYLYERGQAMENMIVSNDITQEYVDYVKAMPEEYYSALDFNYSIDITNNLYTDYEFTNHGGVMSLSAGRRMFTAMLERTKFAEYASFVTTLADTFNQAPDNEDFILSQYEFVTSPKNSKIATEEDEIMIVVNERQELSDLLLAQLGYYTQDEFFNIVHKAVGDEKYDPSLDKDSFSYDTLLNKTFTWYPNDTVFNKTPVASPLSRINPFTYNAVANENFTGGKKLKLTGILMRKKGQNYGCLESGFYYTSALSEAIIKDSANSEIVNYLLDNESTSFISMHSEGVTQDPVSGEMLPYSVDSGITYRYNYYFEGEEHSEVGFVGSTSAMASMIGSAFGVEMPSYYTLTVRELGGCSIPNVISVYPVNFNQKDNVTAYLDAWNANKTITVNGVDYAADERAEIVYSDTVGLIIGMINTMIQMITIALVAFTALSLVVSTVMVGIITYVSVVERVKEIGILRSVGASKGDVKSLFIAETFIIGLASGLVGIIVTYLLSLVINLIVGALTGVFTIAALPVWQAVIMVCISVALTLISGLIPAAAAAKKDPVVALRTE